MSEGIQYHSIVRFLEICRGGARHKGGHSAGGISGSPAFSMPVVDVRSPSEYAQGHIPGSMNVPLFSDEERAQVGTLYKQQGREQAVLCGLAIAGPKLASFAEAALTLCREYNRGSTENEIAVHCWRGGMRSGSFAWLLSAAGLRVHVLEGGYKIFRRHVLDYFEQPQPLRVLGGKTGAGKTLTLHAMAAHGLQVVDLEGLAHHRGSVFGAHAEIPQPTCEHFENHLAMALANCDPAQPIWVEDESENLGRVNLPRPFYSQLRAAPVVVMETPEQQRLERALGEYGTQPRERIAESLDRIRKRLGGLEHRRAHECLAADDLPGVAVILLEYYDRAYTKQLVNRPPAAVVKADSPEHAAELIAKL